MKESNLIGPRTSEVIECMIVNHLIYELKTLSYIQPTKISLLQGNDLSGRIGDYVGKNILIMIASSIQL